MFPTFISRPILNPADATDQQIKEALNQLPVAWNVTTKTIPATDTAGTAIRPRCLGLARLACQVTTTAWTGKATT